MANLIFPVQGSKGTIKPINSHSTVQPNETIAIADFWFGVEWVLGTIPFQRNIKKK